MLHRMIVYFSRFFWSNPSELVLSIPMSNARHRGYGSKASFTYGWLTM